MKQQKLFKILAIVSYLLIILMGQMIGIPFFFWILFKLLEFWSIDQLFAFFAVIGLIISFPTMNSLRTKKILLLDILSFMLLASPIIWRLTAVPIELFNYLAFIIPTVIFAVFYLVSIYFSIRQYLQLKKTIA